MSSSAWDDARRHARALETALDGKMSAYTKAAAGLSRNIPSSSTSTAEPDESDEGAGGYKLLEEEVEELLSKVCEALSRVRCFQTKPPFLLARTSSGRPHDPHQFSQSTTLRIHATRRSTPPRQSGRLSERFLADKSGSSGLIYAVQIAERVEEQRGAGHTTLKSVGIGPT